MSKLSNRADVFVLIGMLVLVGIVLSSTVDETSAPAQAQLAPVEPAIACEPGLIVGGRAIVMQKSVRMRHSAGFCSKQNSADTILHLNTGDVVNIQGGAERKDGLCWWYVQHQSRRGWVADHNWDGTCLLSPAP